MFAPLSLSVLEQLAGGLTPARYPQGAEIIREGEAGDAFYLLADGTAAVTEEGRHRRDLGRGGSFGEIALMRGVPRTATVRAASDIEVYRLSGQPHGTSPSRIPRRQRGRG